MCVVEKSHFGDASGRKASANGVCRAVFLFAELYVRDHQSADVRRYSRTGCDLTAWQPEYDATVRVTRRLHVFDPVDAADRPFRWRSGRGYSPMPGLQGLLEIIRSSESVFQLSVTLLALTGQKNVFLVKLPA